MPKSFSDELNHANKLMREGKFQDALKIIDDLEKGSTLPPGDQLPLLILKGKIYTLIQRYEESVKVGKESYLLSQGLGRVNEALPSLLFKANCVFLGQHDKSLEYLMEAENLLNSLTDISPSYLSGQRANILFRKAYAYQNKGNSSEALEVALECLPLQEKSGRKREIAYTLQLLGRCYSNESDYDIALDYIKRSITLFEELEDKIGLSTSLFVLGFTYWGKGDLDRALTYLKESLSVKSASSWLKMMNFLYIGLIYRTRGALEKALKYFNQVLTLSKKQNDYQRFGIANVSIGAIFRAKGEYELAIEYLKTGLVLGEKMDSLVAVGLSLPLLIMINIEKGSPEEAQQYLDRMEEYTMEKESNWLTNSYQLAKGYLLKKRGGTRNRFEAERLLRKVVDEESNPYLKAYALVFLCEFYLEELHLFDDLEILKELKPIIERLYTFSEEQRMYGYLAEAKLLQAKVALIQMNFEEAQQLLTQAQRIADFYGIKLTAQKISSEHDNLLEQKKEWEELKKKDGPIAERLKLASIDEVIERLQGKRTVEPPELIDEEPILLIIMSRDGISYFNHSFRENWDSSWLFSSFMSAFDTFSSELFSESIDRIKIGENIILINPIESFLVCYVIKGQSYLGLKKLNRFSTAIKDNSEIWENLNRAVKSGEELELEKPSSLGAVVNEIFNQ